METLMLDFAREVATLKRVMLLRGDGAVLPHCEGPALLEELDAALSQLQQRLTLMEDHCQEEESALGSSKALLAQLEAQNTRMAYNLEHLPERVPGFAKAPQIAAASAAADGQPQPAPAPGAPSQSGALKPNNKQTGGAVKPKAKGKGKAASGPAIPTPPVMAYVRADEFEGVPKYVRGRLTQADVNRVVDGFQAALNEKYRILALPRPQLNDMQAQIVSRFQEQSHAKTEGTVFVTDEDLRSLATIKFDRSVQSALTALRCLGRLKEIREGGVLRYAVALSN